MKSCFVRILATIVFMTAFDQQQSFADLSIHFTDSAGNIMTHFESGPDVFQEVNVVIDQGPAGGDLTDFGLLEFGFKVSFDPSKVQLLTTTPFEFSPSFSQHDEPSIKTDYLLVRGGVPFGPDAEAIKSASIVLGTLRLKSLVDAPSEVRIGEYDSSNPGFSDFYLGGEGTVIHVDEQLFGSDLAGYYQFTIASAAAVPEPGSLALLALTLSGGLLARRKGVRPLF